MSDEILNRVSKSNLSQIDLEDYLPKEEILEFDLAQNLFQGLILREKDFRDFLSDHNWGQYKNRKVALFCSADAIVPNWAFMLVASKLKEHSSLCYFGSVNEVKEELLIQHFEEKGLEDFRDARILVKGCGSFELSPGAYVRITNILQPIVKSLMFGEACSSVPVFKSKA